MMHSLHNFVLHYKYAGIFAAIGLGVFGLPVPDETILAFVGFLVYKGNLLLVPALLSSFIGAISGITVSYFLGRFVGHSFIDKYSSRLHIKAEHVRRARQWYDRYGKLSLVIGYFIPGVRHFSAILSGISLCPYVMFALYAYSGGFLWCLTFIGFGFYAGEEWHTVAHFAEGHVLPMVIAGTLLLIIVLFFARWRWKRNTNSDIF